MEGWREKKNTYDDPSFKEGDEGTLGILDALRSSLGTLLRLFLGFSRNPGGWFLKGVSWDGSATVHTSTHTYTYTHVHICHPHHFTRL